MFYASFLSNDLGSLLLQHLHDISELYFFYLNIFHSISSYAFNMNLNGILGLAVKTKGYNLRIKYVGLYMLIFSIIY